MKPNNWRERSLEAFSVLVFSLADGLSRKIVSHLLVHFSYSTGMGQACVRSWETYAVANCNLRIN